MQEVLFGKYLKELREKNKLTLRQVEIQSGVSDSYLSQVETGQRGVPKPDIIKKLAPVYKTAYEELLVAAGYLNSSLVQSAGRVNRSPENETSPGIAANAIPIDEAFIVSFPVYGKISAGIPITAVEQSDERISMDTRFLNMSGYTTDDFFFLRISGHSMEPTISDGDLVLIRKQPMVDNGEIAAVLCDKEDATVKRVVLSGGKMILSSDNKDYQPMVFDAAQCTILGKVMKKLGDVR